MLEKQGFSSKSKKSVNSTERLEIYNKNGISGSQNIENNSDMPQAGSTKNETTDIRKEIASREARKLLAQNKPSESVSAGLPTPNNIDKKGKNKRGVYQSTVEIMQGEGNLKIGKQSSSQAPADMKQM